MNILKEIRAEEKRINKRVEQYRSTMGLKADDDLTEVRNKIEQQEEDFFEYITRKGFRRLIRIKEIGQEEGYYPSNEKITNTFFITIRPDETKINFITFFNNMKKLFERKCFINYIYSHEQKGTSEETLGNGFHLHAIAKCTQRSKTEVLRDIQNTCKNYTAANCIDVKLLKNDNDVTNVKKYMIDYESDDGHKIVTKEWDTIWRNKNKLEKIYSSEPAIKSEGQAISIDLS